MKPPIKSREALQEEAFSELSSKIGDIELRGVSSRSWTLLSRMGNPLMIGINKESKEDKMSQMVEGVIQYAYIHSAPLEKVVTIVSEKDIDPAELTKIGFSISIGQAIAFMNEFTKCAERFSASMAEVEEADEEETEGKSPVSPPAGLQRSVSPSVSPVILSESVTSSGLCPSPGPLLTSMPQMSPTELPAGGYLLMPPTLEKAVDPSSESSPTSVNVGEPITPTE